MASGDPRGKTYFAGTKTRHVAVLAALVALGGGACGISKPSPATPTPGLDASTEGGLAEGGSDADAAISFCPGVDQTCWAANLTPAPYGCQDRHCVDSDGGARTVDINYASCGIDTSTVVTDAGAGDTPASAGAISADDDSCAYHVRVLPLCAAKPREIDLTVELSSITDGTRVAGADPYVLVYSGFTHLAPPSGTTTTETAPGVYRIGPIDFDIPGTWTITVHFFGTCVEGRASPHTHLSFSLNVP